MASADFPADSYAAASRSRANTALAWAGPSSPVLVATMDFQYEMAARDSLPCSSESPARNSSGWASGFHSIPPSVVRSAEAQSRSACSSWACPKWAGSPRTPWTSPSGQVSSSASAAAVTTCSRSAGGR